MSQQLINVATKGKWVEGMKTNVQARDFAFIVDEPEALGGTDQGANPVEYVLAALSGCTSVVIALIAKELDFKYEDATFENEGTLDLRGLNGVEGVSPHFQTVTFDVTIVTDESEERLDELKSKVEKRCPVYNLLKDAGIALESNWVKKATVSA
ncbi:OsmC family protein [Bacillus sp. Marseille-Q1617]|uniref:OsmC family protein n=1 Tax=Bacillus sp. Marseille-Q1617 TaxID=2736887 RepID=UPI00158DCA43|nr:OsmC family protein [Bacillus sp. Marseille-Q1617]